MGEATGYRTIPAQNPRPYPWYRQMPMNAKAVDMIRRFYDANRRELFVYALALTASREGAEDALHAAFEGVLRQARLPRELRPYVFRAIRNAAMDHHRKAARAAAHVERVLFVPNGHPDPKLPLLLEDALAKLGDDERETIVLKTYSGLTLREIAESRDVSINTVASWHRRGLEKLRTILEDSPA